MEIRPHSVHSFNVMSSFLRILESILRKFELVLLEISIRADMELATTIWLESSNKSISSSKNPCSTHSLELRSKNLATQMAAVFRTLEFQPKFRAVHVAGTNGKGSVCSYVSHVLSAHGIANGRFNSPHLLDRWDSVQVNDRQVYKDAFLATEAHVHNISAQYNINCSEFELLTCTALKLFNRTGVEVAVLETGLGGRLDATNVLAPENIICTGITKIGLDHEALLGSTLPEIAYEKAGIIKHGVPCVVDGSNAKSVLEVVEQVAGGKKAPLTTVSNSPDQSYHRIGSKLGDFHTNLHGDYQQSNLAVALGIIDVLSASYKLNRSSIDQGIRNTTWPGRLQKLTVRLETGELPAILDGAHNSQAAEQLTKYLGERNAGTTFVVAMTSGKATAELFDKLLTPKDTIICTEFASTVDGMPWIESYKASELAANVHTTNNVHIEPNLEKALERASLSHQQTVICGSLRSRIESGVFLCGSPCNPDTSWTHPSGAPPKANIPEASSNSIKPSDHTSPLTLCSTLETVPEFPDPSFFKSTSSSALMGSWYSRPSSRFWMLAMSSSVEAFLSGSLKPAWSSGDMELVFPRDEVVELVRMVSWGAESVSFLTFFLLRVLLSRNGVGGWFWEFNDDTTEAVSCCWTTRDGSDNGLMFKNGNGRRSCGCTVQESTESKLELEICALPDSATPESTGSSLSAVSAESASVGSAGSADSTGSTGSVSCCSSSLASVSVETAVSGSCSCLSTVSVATGSSIRSFGSVSMRSTSFRPPATSSTEVSGLITSSPGITWSSSSTTKLSLSAECVLGSCVCARLGDPKSETLDPLLPIGSRLPTMLLARASDRNLSTSKYE
ncbi:hypothetical protein OGAPHI_005006 [Ogataea philodendri]|uniref:Dihydrofolate synthetase n=1 Tax=Ogataea philodendri TaxID=1378263 RepID=A0A9P8T339_9ASCO|nr:uncharacterized protein OGAPHI_005006 [Ogataea philodendri]KAH3663605.1 hypothetical protein OGAPHI_005006 [Ogataea philodendri]